MIFQSLSQISETIANLPTADMESTDKALKRDAVLTKPAGALGRLEELAVWASGWQQKHPPTFKQPQVAIFAGNHGVCAQGVSAFPSEVTVQMVANFDANGAAINQLADQYGARFSVWPLELETPTADFTLKPAMTEEELLTAVNIGWKAVEKNSDFLVIGEMGIGNTTVAAAICTALFGGNGEDWAGPGTGIGSDGISRKAAAINSGLARHADFLSEPLKVMQHLGGRELAAMIGATLAARYKSIPVILDGFVTCAAVAPLFKMNEKALDHCIVGHCSAEPGHVKLLQHLKQKPLLNLSMRLGEGSGAAVALGIVQSAIVTHTGMASFAEAGVSDQD